MALCRSYCLSLALVMTLVLPLRSLAQERPIVEVDTIRFGSRILSSCQFALVPSNFTIDQWPAVKWQQLSSKNFKITPADNPKKVLVRFLLVNKSDTTRGFYFFPGFYYKDIHLYKRSGEKAIPFPRILPDHPDSIGFRYISIAGRDTSEVLAVLTNEKTYNTVISPRLIRESFYVPYMVQFLNKYRDIDMVTYVFSGLLLMMILFSLATYAMGATREFLFYAGYAFFLGAMLFTKSMFNFQINPTSYLFETFLDFVLQAIGHCCYLAFMMYFLDTKKAHPFLHRLYKFGILWVLMAILAYTVLYYGTSAYLPVNLVENGTKFFLILLAIIFMVYSARHWNDRLLRFLFWGNLLLIVFSVFSQLLILIPALRSNNSIFYNSLFYYEVGLFLELIFFLVGLTYKNRKQIILQTRERERLKIENERKELEKQMAVMAAHQEERERISADMHDELGSGMTTIRLMSEIAKKKMKQEVPIELEKISQSANDVLNKMNAIIWSMNSGNDTLDNLISYIRAYSIEYFEGTPVQCKVNTPPQIPERQLTGDKRRNIFLCVKESLNNVLKHAQASNVEIDIRINTDLIITITDNGTGIDLAKLREFGNGLKNISQRMAKIGGAFFIENRNGTVTSLVYPL